jgi:dTDP-glucose pyrophosphorylase
LAQNFADGNPICVVLGDNFIEMNICKAVETFERQKSGAKILLKEVPDAERFGVAEIRGEHVFGIEEKPKIPKSNYAVIGVYLYDNTVFEKIQCLKPSGRGELEITDVNNFYIQEGTLTYETLDGWWTDAGTFDSLLRANTLVAKLAPTNFTSKLAPPPAPIGKHCEGDERQKEGDPHLCRGIHSGIQVSGRKWKADRPHPKYLAPFPYSCQEISRKQPPP